MTPETYLKAQLAATVLRDGDHLGGVDPLLAMALVLRNRRQAGWHGGDWMQLLEAHEQYAAWLPPPAAPDLRDLRIRLFLQQVDDVFSGLAVDQLTEGALYYAELHRVERAWFRENICQQPAAHPRVAQVGQLVLFR